MKGKEYVLRPMSPSQVIADKQTTHHGEKSEKVTHPKVSESHKPNMSASSPRKKNLILFATKSEMREVCENPSNVMHFVLVCKDGEPTTNTSHELPLVFQSLLQELQMFSPMSYLWVYLHYEALSIESTSSPERHFQTKPHTVSIPKKPRRFNGKYNNSSTTVMYTKA